MATYKRLGDLLIDMGFITEEQLGEALKLQKGTNRRIGEVLTKYGFVTEQQIIEALKAQLGIQFVDLSKMIIPTEMAQVLSKNIAQKYGIVPIKVERDALHLAMSDPLNFFAIEEVKAATRKQIIPVLSTAAAIDRAIATLYGNERAIRAIEDMKRETHVGRDGETSYQVNEIDEDSEQYAPTIRLSNSIIARAIDERASDIHLESFADEMRVRMRIDGMMRNIMVVPKELQASVLSRFKIIGGMDISERKVAQDGRANVRIHQRDVDLRMSTLPTIHGEKLVIRLLDKNAQLLKKEAIGLTGGDLDKYNGLIQSRSGVVLIAGPTGSGKSSTMYTMLQELCVPEVNIITLEDPVEYQVDGINQVQINEKTGVSFANGLRAILRQDPDIIGVGEIRDGETASIAMRAAITGHYVISTIHTNNASAAIDRLMDIGVEPYLIAGAIRGVISQRLVRKICPHCRTEYEATDEEKEILGIPLGEQHKIYKGTGCPNCFHTGFIGRTGVFEILIPDRKLRQAINSGAGRDELKQIIEEGNFVSFRDNCRRLVLEGVTTVSEAVRTIHSSDL